MYAQQAALLSLIAYVLVTHHVIPPILLQHIPLKNNRSKIDQASDGSKPSDAYLPHKPKAPLSPQKRLYVSFMTNCPRVASVYQVIKNKKS